MGEGKPESEGSSGRDNGSEADQAGPVDADRRVEEQGRKAMIVAPEFG